MTHPIPDEALNSHIAILGAVPMTGVPPMKNTDTPSIERLKELLAKATRVRDEISYRDKGDGEERYELIGDPCGFPVAVFGDHNDALFDLAARKVIATLETLTPSAGEVELDGATPDQMQRANNAVEANLVDGAPKYDSAQGYACALTAIMQTDAALASPPPQPDIEGRAREAVHLQIFWSDDAESVLCVNEEEVVGCLVEGVTYKAASLDANKSAIVKALSLPTTEIRREAWQPIETAPKDGSEILGCWWDQRGRPRISIIRWMTADQIAAAENGDPAEFTDAWDDDGDEAIASHWQPLPVPPAPLVSKEDGRP